LVHLLEGRHCFLGAARVRHRKDEGVPPDPLGKGAVALDRSEGNRQAGLDHALRDVSRHARSAHAEDDDGLHAVRIGKTGDGATDLPRARTLFGESLYRAKDVLRVEACDPIEVVQ
jgi:hypothetical protein